MRDRNQAEIEASNRSVSEAGIVTIYQLPDGSFVVESGFDPDHEGQEIDQFCHGRRSF